VSQPYTIRECLHGYTDEALSEMCERWQVAASSKPNRIRALEKVLGDPLHIESTLRGLSLDAVRLLHLVADNGTLSIRDVLHVPGLYTKRDPVNALHEAAFLGLVLVCPEERTGAFSFNQIHPHRDSRESSPLLFASSLVKHYLPAAEPMGLAMTPATNPPEKTSAPSADRATAFFLETLRIVELLNPRVTAADMLHKADLTRAQEQAREAQMPVEAFSLSLMTALELGCVETKRGRLVTTPKAGEWASRPYAKRMKDLLGAYAAGQSLPDIKLFFPQLIDSFEEHLPRGAVRRTYHRLLAAHILREQPEGVWFAVNTLVRALYDLDHNVLCLEEQWRSIASNSRDNSPVWKDRQWEMREQRLFTWMIQSFLFDLGIVELADEGKYFRVTPTGRYALGVGPQPDRGEASTHDALVVQPDFEVIVYVDRCSPNLRRTLDTFCERVQGGMVSTYRLTEQSVYRGSRTGTSIKNFLDMLAANSKMRIPANVSDQFASWERKLESVLVHGSCEVIECLTAKDASALVTEHPHCRLIGERFVLASDPIPEVDTIIDYNKARRPSIEQEDGLVVRAPWEKIDLFLRRQLDDLGDSSTTDTGDIMLRLVKKKVAQGSDWSLQLAQLESLASRPLSGRYRLALRAWSGELDQAASRTATLVRFGDAETAQAILDFPDLAEHIEGSLGLFTLVIHQGQLGAFKKKLKQRGILVKPEDAIHDTAPPEEWATQWVLDHRLTEDTTNGGANGGGANAPQAEEKPRTRKPRIHPAKEEPEPEENHLPSYSTRIVREILEDAISRRRPVLVEYKNTWGTRPSIRRVDPVSLETAGAAPALSGYCHQRKGARTFKLSQVAGIRVLEDEQF